jgi:hypothetical protein
VSRSASKRVDADDEGVLTAIAYFPHPASRSSPPAVSAIVGERPSRANWLAATSRSRRVRCFWLCAVDATSPLLVGQAGLSALPEPDWHPGVAGGSHTLAAAPPGGLGRPSALSLVAWDVPGPCWMAWDIPDAVPIRGCL